MPTEDPNDLDHIDQEIRINELKCEAEELAGGQMVAWESDDCPPGIAEQFWEHVVAFEKAPWTSTYQQLMELGVELPPPEELNDEQVHDKLSEMIHALAGIDVYFCSTDHLSDRELYDHLWSETLHQRVADVSIPGMVHTIDLAGSGSEEDTEVWMQYYADDETRDRWQKDFPDYVMPPREKPPYDRDQHLPKAPQE